MPHHVYTTRAIVLRTRHSRETDKSVLLLTRDLGLISGSARGARKPGSKLGSSLLDLSLAKVSLVRGRHAWRITTVTLLRDSASELRGRREALRALSRVWFLIERLVRGEEKNTELFDGLEEATLSLLAEIVDEDVDAWELLTVARALHGLGYLGEEALPRNLEEVRERRRALVRVVNTGIKESGLA